MLGFNESVLLPSALLSAAPAAGGADGTLTKLCGLLGSVLLVLPLGGSLLLLLLLLPLSWMTSAWNIVRRAVEPPAANQTHVISASTWLYCCFEQRMCS
jgi:hypothetical protein